MTIYTAGVVDKDPKGTWPEVVTTESEPLKCLKDSEAARQVPVPAPAKSVLRVTYNRRNQQRVCCVHFTLVVLLMVFLTCGVIGSVVFYKHLNRKATYSGVCGVRYTVTDTEEWQRNAYEAAAASSLEEQNEIISSYDNKKLEDGLIPKGSQLRVRIAEEGIEVSELEKFEYLHMPRFGEVRETNIWHDFNTNFSAIIDIEQEVCYIMHLNRSAIAPPKNVIDLLMKSVSGYLLKYAQVVHHSYKKVKELPHLDNYGSRIKSRCEDPGYTSYFVEKIVSRLYRRSIQTDKKVLSYSMMNNYMENPQIFKIDILD